ncbi:DMT family transporter [Solemya velesiana gill symbiont]|uniref:DMT family transporter n=1 Tax=Solemya velesiana gill symbiont TaxID=1918948 RepID=UPI00318369D1
MTTLFWAGNAVVGKVAVGLISGIEISFWRWVIALLLLTPFAYKAVIHDLAYYRDHWVKMLLLGFLSVSVYNTFQYLALQWTSVINVGVVTATMPLMVFMLTWIAGQERASRFQQLGLFVALCGVLLVITRGSPSVLLGLKLNPGDLLMLLAVFSFALYSVLIKPLPSSLDKLGLLWMLVFLGVLGILPFYLWDITRHHTFTLDMHTGLILLYVGIFPSILSYFFWNKAVTLGGANLAGMFCNLIPVYALLLAVVLLGESLSSYQLFGMLGIFAEIFLATSFRTRPGKRKT